MNDASAQSADPRNSTRALVTRLARECIRPYFGWLALAILFMALVAGTTGFSAWLMDPMVNKVFVEKNRAILFPIGGAIFATFMVKGLANYGQAALMAFVGQRIITDTQNRLYAHLTRMELGFFHSHPTGNLIFTAKNRCTRNEPSGFRALTRQRNFTMREIMVLGDRDFVLLYRQKMLDTLRDLVEQLGMTCKIESASDPFFTNDAAYKAVFQHSFKLKYECLAELPFSKDRLAIASVNLHNDTFGKAFGVTLSGGSTMHSACLAFGLERWAYALLSQYGWDRAQWQDPLLHQISELQG